MSLSHDTLFAGGKTHLCKARLLMREGLRCLCVFVYAYVVRDLDKKVLRTQRGQDGAGPNHEGKGR